MPDIESAVKWRPWSVAVILAVFLSVFTLVRFGLLSFSFPIGLGCAVLCLPLGWNIAALRKGPSGERPGRNDFITDGLLVVGLALVFIGAFF